MRARRRTNPTMTNTNTNDLVVSCARALGTSCWCWLVGGWFSIILDDDAMHFLLSFTSSILPFSELHCSSFYNVEPCTHTCCVYVLYSISPSTAYVRTPTAARGIEILLFGLDAIWYIIIHPQQSQILSLQSSSIKTHRIITTTCRT
jgi:hypothetical protein